MKIVVVSAIGGTKIEIDVDPSTTFREIKQKISQLKRIPIDTFVLAYQGKELKDDSNIKETGIYEQEKIYLIVRTEGGKQ